MASSVIEHDAKDVDAGAQALPDVRSLVHKRTVACVGKLASMTREQFADVIATLGGTFTNSVGGPGRGVSLIVIGQKDWPIGRSGQVWPYLRQARVKKRREGYRFTVLSERLFLEGLGMREEAESTHRLYSISTITDLLGVTRNQVRAWVKAGLVEPVRVDGGVWYFDFRQVSAASTIGDLMSRGVAPGSLRRQLKHFQGWLPDMEHPLSQLARIEAGGSVIMRLAQGDLSADDGQLLFDFDATTPTALENDRPPMRLVVGPSSASEWHEEGIAQEQAGYLDEAIESYREALALGGPNVQISFDLAHALQQTGRREEAAERYRQVVEMQSDHADAWNNLGVLLSEQGRLQEARDAFRRVLAIDPRNVMAIYNVADTLDELGQRHDAGVQWRAYLRFDTMSERAGYARRRASALGS
jgi:tetratricopeptide (TPR) repeat protein